MKACAIDACTAPLAARLVRPDPRPARGGDRRPRGEHRSAGRHAAIRRVLRSASPEIRRDAKKRGIDHSFPFTRSDGAQRAAIAGLVDTDTIRPLIDKTFEFGETPTALDRAISGRARGEVVVRIGRA